MTIDPDLLLRFEIGLNPQHLEASAVPAALVGYGEISAIFQIGDDFETAYKRMPLFKSRAAAEDYERMYHDYCGLLQRAGLNLPGSRTFIVEAPNHPVTLYIAQDMLPASRFGHQLIHTLGRQDIEHLMERIMGESGKIRAFNEEHRPGLEIAIDGQLSNWVMMEDELETMYYIDTSTPLVRDNGVHRLDPRLILQAAPRPLRPVFEWLFAEEVMNRYFDPHQNMTDLAGNLFKEQKPELIPEVIRIINRGLPEEAAPLTAEAVEKYYRHDKLIWSLFLGIRRLDRWILTRLLRRRYEFILPGNIER